MGKKLNKKDLLSINIATKKGYCTQRSIYECFIRNRDLKYQQTKNKNNMVLHYSVNFENGFPHHGEVEYPLNVCQNFEPYVNSMTAFVKPALTKSIKKWGFTPDDMVGAEFYFYKGSEEIIFFSWEKETPTKSTTTQ